MKVLLLNGSPHEKGCTYTALNEIAKTLEHDGVEAEILWLGNDPVTSCRACGACRKLHKCAFDDITNTVISKLSECDGLIIGSPVHYAGASGQVTAVMDRVFYAASALMRHKPGAAIAVARRAGTTATFDVLNKYFGIAQMINVGSTYWNEFHALTKEDVPEDGEGLQTLRNLARNMVYVMRCLKAGRDAGIAPPVAEADALTNFVRREGEGK